MPTLELDIAHDCEPSHEQLTKDAAQKHGLTVTLLKEFGPAGGNPLYLFEGPRKGLESLVRDIYQDCDEDHQISRIKD